MITSFPALYVIGFSPQTTEEDLADLFTKNGFPPTVVTIFRPSRKLYAFVEFEHGDMKIIGAARNKLHGQIIGFRRMSVSHADVRPK